MTQRNPVGTLVERVVQMLTRARDPVSGDSVILTHQPVGELLTLSLKVAILELIATKIQITARTVAFDDGNR